MPSCMDLVRIAKSGVLVPSFVSVFMIGSTTPPPSRQPVQFYVFERKRKKEKMASLNPEEKENNEALARHFGKLQ